MVASDANTHNPPVVYSRTDDTEKKITVAEAERLMLWPAGVTDGSSGGDRWVHGPGLGLIMDIGSFICI